jgi:ferric iron reductase FhuF-like transporter/IucA/IucC family protein
LSYDRAGRSGTDPHAPAWRPATIIRVSLAAVAEAPLNPAEAPFNPAEAPPDPARRPPDDPAGAHLATARALVLGRLWGCLAREPIAGLAGRSTEGGDLVGRFADGRVLRGPATAAQPFAVPPAGLAPPAGSARSAGLLLWLDGVGLADPGTVVRALGLPGAVHRLAAELDDSVANLALARAARPGPDLPGPGRGRPGRPGPDPRRPELPGGARLFAALSRLGPDHEVDPLAIAEQLVVDGHPLHPGCRTRLGLTAAQVRAYAPEHHPIVELVEVAVPPDRWLGIPAGAPPRLVLHPGQAERVCAEYPWLTPTGTVIPARPLMSLRTLATVHRPREHLKTALDVQLTSAVRVVSPAAIHNGPLLSRLLPELLRRLAGRDGQPRLAIQPEVGGGAALVDGEPNPRLAVLRRPAPTLAPGEVVLPAAALAARSPIDGRPLLVEAVSWGYPGDPAGFLDEALDLLLPPLLGLLRLGVALEAHGQNVLLVLRRGRPVRAVYRDLGGVRVSPRRLARYGIQAPPLRGDLPTDDEQELRTKLFAALLATLVGELVAVLGREYGQPVHWWDRVAAAARRAYRSMPDDPCGRADAAALFGPTLPVKAVLAMRLAARPVQDIWAELPNPMAGDRDRAAIGR